MKPQKVFLYLEFKNLGLGGAYTSYKNQKKMLDILGIPYCESWDNSAEIFQSNSAWLKSLYYIWKARRHDMKVIIWGHSTAEDVRGFFRSKLFDRLTVSFMQRYFKYVYGLADMVLCPTPYTHGILERYGLPHEKLVVQSNGVDTNIFYPDPEKRAACRAEFNLGGLVIGTVAIVIPRKGVDTFLMLAKKFSDNQCVWFGKIFHGALVKPLPKNLPKNTQFTGHMSNANIQAAFNALDIFLFPSYEENQGMAILEAAAIGLPIIVRDLPVYEGWLKNGSNCLKAKTDDEFTTCLEQLTANEALRKQLGANARLLAADESLEPLALRFKDIYSRLTREL